MKKDHGIRVYVLAAILIVLVLYVGVGVIRIYNDEKEHSQRVANGEYDNYHNQPNNPYGAPIVYYRSDLERVVGVRLRESDVKLSGFKCKKYWNNGNEPTKYDHLRFYLFEKERTAEKALKAIKEQSFYRITDEGENYVRGWLADVWDADIENYYYRNGNLIVEAVVTSVDMSARDVNDPTSPVTGGGKAALELIEMINTTF